MTRRTRRRQYRRKIDVCSPTRSCRELHTRATSPSRPYSRATRTIDKSASNVSSPRTSSRLLILFMKSDRHSIFLSYFHLNNFINFLFLFTKALWSRRAQSANEPTTLVEILGSTQELVHLSAHTYRETIFR